MSIKMSRKTKKTLVCGVIGGAVLGILLTFAAANKALGIKEEAMANTQVELKNQNKDMQDQIKKQTTAGEAATLSTKSVEKWELVLVNATYPLDTQYQPELADLVNEYKVDARIVEDAKQMMADAETGGLKLHIISAYRSYDDQKVAFNDTMQAKIYEGSTPLDAYEQTKQSVEVPGYSEHALGLALDITSEEYQELDDKQAETAETKWMMENCYKYGFILRYPVDSTGMQGSTFKPWHYRYVGKEAAKEITEKGITFEEYLEVK